MKYNADKNTKTEIKRGIIERERAKRYKSTISVQTRLIVLRIFATESWSFFILTIRTRGAETTRELKIIQDGLGLDALKNLIKKLEDFSNLSEGILNQDTVNLLLSEAIDSVKILKESLKEEEVVE